MSIPPPAAHLLTRMTPHAALHASPQRPGRAFADAVKPRSAAKPGRPTSVPRASDVAARAAGPEEAATSQPVRARRDSDPDDTTDDEPNEPLSDVSPGGTDADEPPSPRGLDPLERAMYQPMATRSPAAPATHAAPPHEGPTAPAVDALVDRFLKRFAMSGDRHRGTAALQIGSGALAGSAVTLHAEGKEVRIVVDAPEGPEVLALAARLRARLSAKGLSVSVEVGSG